MKKTGELIFIIMLLFVGLAITPAMGSMYEAGITTQPMFYNYIEKEEMVTIDFFDYTGTIPIKNEVKLPKSEWISIRNELRTIRKSSKSIEESLEAQLIVFKEHNLISDDSTYENIMGKAVEKSENMNLPRVFNRIKPTPIINNSIINAMCIINFELTNGTTAVFGLNTFVNLIGFDIVSFHKGYSPDGIDTKGILTQATAPGEYIGTMFGFFGAWIGEKTIPGFYSNVTVAGFSVITAWLPIPLFP